MYRFISTLATNVINYLYSFLKPKKISMAAQGSSNTCRKAGRIRPPRPPSGLQPHVYQYIVIRGPE